jgi:transcriptional regulator with XRE-family HTH domain
MRISRLTTDEAILGELGGRLARIRLDRNLTQHELAAQAGVSKRTVERMEAGAVATQLSSLIRVCRILGLAERFEVLIPEPIPSPVEQLKMRRRKRQRARIAKKSNSPIEKWQWGDKP